MEINKMLQEDVPDSTCLSDLISTGATFSGNNPIEYQCSISQHIQYTFFQNFQIKKWSVSPSFKDIFEFSIFSTLRVPCSYKKNKTRKMFVRPF